MTANDAVQNVLSKTRRELTSQERPKSVLYLKLKKREVFKIVKKGPPALFENYVFWKLRKKMKGGHLETLNKFQKNPTLRFLTIVTAKHYERETLCRFLASILLHIIGTNEGGSLWWTPVIFKKTSLNPETNLS